MKKIADLERELEGVKYRLKNDEMKPAAEKRLRKRIPFLKTCIAYLESKPSEIFVTEEVAKVELKINRRMELFVLDDYQALDKKTVNRMKKTYEKKYEVPHLREQVRTLRFLLK